MYHPILVLDIETITDLALGKQLYDLDLENEDIEQALLKLRRQETGQDFQRLALHEIVCISGLWFNEGKVKIFSWTQEHYSEDEILNKFFKIFEKYQPILVTWNGSQFDLPLLMIRSMIHGVSSPTFWDQGELYAQKRYNNYLNRYHPSHLDLMDNLAMFYQKHFTKLDDMAKILGLAGKEPEESLNVMTSYVKDKRWSEISHYCESDVINTWLIYLRWLLLKGLMKPQDHLIWVKYTISLLQQQPQYANFLERWQKNAQISTFSQQFFE